MFVECRSDVPVAFPIARNRSDGTRRGRHVYDTSYPAIFKARMLTALNICAAVVKGGAGTDPAKPVCINIDGSTYYYTFQMPEKVQGYLQPMLKERGLHIRCIQVEDAPVVGAAIAGLTAF